MADTISLQQETKTKQQQVVETLDKLGVEPWVDAEIVAAHTGFKSDHIRKMAVDGKIPASTMTNGKRKHWRFKISEVDAALTKGMKQ